MKRNIFDINAISVDVNNIVVDQPVWGGLVNTYNFEFSDDGDGPLIEQQSGLELTGRVGATQSGGLGVFTGGYYDAFPDTTPALLSTEPFVLTFRWLRTAPDTLVGFFGLACDTDNQAPSLTFLYTFTDFYMLCESSSNGIWGSFTFTPPLGSLNDGVWHEMRIEYDGVDPKAASSFSATIDGKATVVAATAPTSSSNWRTFIGAGTFANSYFYGSIDYIRVSSQKAYADAANAKNVFGINAKLSEINVVEVNVKVT